MHKFYLSHVFFLKSPWKISLSNLIILFIFLDSSFNLSLDVCNFIWIGITFLLKKIELKIIKLYAIKNDNKNIFYFTLKYLKLLKKMFKNAELRFQWIPKNFNAYNLCYYSVIILWSKYKRLFNILLRCKVILL